jgi:leucyl-tRNA synthetase
MAKTYNHKAIEAKWQKVWERKQPNKASDSSAAKKFYSLIEFPYPSGDGLHVGHIRSNTAMDIISRKRRAEGYNVLYPIGWDAFGLPTENYAIKHGLQPQVVTKKNTDTFRRQLKSIGFSFDWSREINTTDPKYYKWTQWIFLQFLKKGLAYKKKMAVNWCPKDKTGLANEEVIDGKCERCGTPVEKRDKEQWMLAITKYADRLDKDLDDVNYLERIKIQQRNWIGKSEGAELEFKIKGTNHKIKVFTTRPDTLFGVTYIVLAPEHELIKELYPLITNWEKAQAYINEVKSKDEIVRTAENKEKTGVELQGVTAINPINNDEVPVWIADYVLSTYGTGAVMAVPAHDERDHEFAQKFQLPIQQIEAHNDLETKKRLTKEAGGKMVTIYKLRDWVFSRQRYWGEPIPVIHCESCGIVPVPEKDLPVTLPKVKNYQPTDNGESPLAAISSWVNVKCPNCKGKAKRETDTMPNWAGSSWYFLRYIDPKNAKVFADKAKIEKWTPIDWYNGGMEHTTLHLLYSRFWHKFLFDLGLVTTSEPYQKRTSHGLVLAQGGEKMSKSKGNVVNPDDVVKLYGADTLRVYEMFMGPFDQPIAWSTDNMIGSRRFLERIWRLIEKVDLAPKALSADGELGALGAKSGELDALVHKTIKKVSDDIESMSFNTAISSLMILLNALEKESAIGKATYKILLQLTAPFAPHITEELWSSLKEKKSVHEQPWPDYDPAKLVASTVTITVQVNGKMRDTLEISPEATEEEVKNKAMSLENVNKWLDKAIVKRVIYVKNRLINIVI